MNPEKIKCDALVDRFYQNSPEEFGTAKAMSYAIKMALICVDEIIKTTFSKRFVWDKLKVIVQEKSTSEYWDEVLKHLEKLWKENKNECFK